jgi:hypothetical protein
MRCTPASVLSHSLYERANPHRSFEPGGVLETGTCEYEAVDDRTVRVSGGRFMQTPYTVRLEAAEFVGYRSIAIGGIRDPLVLGQLRGFIQGVEAVVREKVQQSLRLDPSRYSMRFVVYGENGSMGAMESEEAVSGHEVGVLIDVVAPTQELAHGIVFLAWHNALHYPIPEYSGLASHLAFPFSPPEVNVGPVYRFSLNHVMQIDDPVAAFPVKLERV